MKFDFHLEQDIWGEREYLRTIKRVSHERMVSPWAVLGMVIINTLTSVPYTLCLPATVGTRAPLNLHLAIVGASGAGKGAALGVADELRDSRAFVRVPIGSGEGLVTTYGEERTDDGHSYFDWANRHHAAQFLASEVSGLIAQSKRQGSTLMEQLLKMYSGEELGFSYKNSNRAIVPKMEYRGCCIVHVQPELSSGLLENGASGFPQRFLWVSATDPNLPVPGTELPSKIVPLDFPQFDNATCDGDVSLPDEAIQEVRATRFRTVRGEGSGLDGHALQTRLKVAVALAVLDGRTDEVSLDDWCIAGVIMSYSDAVRAYCLGVLEAKRLDEARKDGAARGASDAAREEAREEARAKAIEDTKLTIIEKIEGYGPMKRGYLTQKLTKTHRRLKNDAVAELINDGVLVEDGGGVLKLPNQ